MTSTTFLAAFLVAPFLLLDFYIAADRFGWPIAGRVLDMVGATLKLQFVIGALVNIAVGVAMVGLAMWMVRQNSPIALQNDTITAERATLVCGFRRRPS